MVGSSKLNLDAPGSPQGGEDKFTAEFNTLTMTVRGDGNQVWCRGGRRPLAITRPDDAATLALLRTLDTSSSSAAHAPARFAAGEQHQALPQSSKIRALSELPAPLTPWG